MILNFFNVAKITHYLIFKFEPFEFNSRPFFTGPNEAIPIGYEDSGVICDDEKQCRCLIESVGCDSTPCSVTSATAAIPAKDGICIGKFLQKQDAGFLIFVFELP